MLTICTLVDDAIVSRISIAEMDLKAPSPRLVADRTKTFNLHVFLKLIAREFFPCQAS